MWELKNAWLLGRKTWKESQLPAKELGLQLHSMEVSSADQFDGALSEPMEARSAALALTPMVLAAQPSKRKSSNWRRR